MPPVVQQSRPTQSSSSRNQLLIHGSARQTSTSTNARDSSALALERERALMQECSSESLIGRVTVVTSRYRSLRGFERYGLGYDSQVILREMFPSKLAIRLACGRDSTHEDVGN